MKLVWEENKEKEREKEGRRKVGKEEGRERHKDKGREESHIFRKCPFLSFADMVPKQWVG